MSNNVIAADLPKEMQSHHYPILFQVEESHWWYVGRRRIIQSLVERICATLNNTSPSILDVGCGTGANLKMLAAYGKAEGVDISPQAVEFCRQRGLDSVRLGAAEDLPYEDDSFELVTALDVIEHLDDDVAGLREMRRVLRRDGRILLFVPAFMFLWGVQDDVSNHRRRYTLPSLLKAVEAAGFSVEWSSYANISFFLPVLVVRSVMRWLGLSAATEYGINISLMNGPFAQLFAAERFILKRGKIPFGVSAICIARRVED
ncbi:MAG TPA: methyltransferase domain-containing protein [Pyrinomonadaceae bacterium]|nr:methyltransferase domain-containing protein [Pyrinomonadaceae bacterium]